MFIVSRKSGVGTMNRENQLLIFIKCIVILGVVAWNVLRIIQTRHCWKRREPCENSQCKWWYFCDKHGESLIVDIYRMEKIEEMMRQEQEEQNK